MTATRCLICSNEALLDFVNSGLVRGLSAKGLAAAISAVGDKPFDPDVVSRHRANHWTAPVAAGTPKPTRRDLAIMMRDKVAEAVEPMTPEQVLSMDKNAAAMIGQGLRAEGLLDKRAATKQKLGLAAGYLGLQLLLRGVQDPPAVPVLLDDGNTIEGDFVPVD